MPIVHVHVRESCRGFDESLPVLASREGDSHMKGTGMLVVSLRGENFGFWSRLGCSGKMSLFLAVEVSFRVAREEITIKKEF